MKIIILSLVLLATLNLKAEIGNSSSVEAVPRPRTRPTISSDKSSSVKAPACFDEATVVSDSKKPEALIQSAFEGLSDDEVHARLVLAESLASGKECSASAQRQGIFEGVAWVISNRMNHPEGAYGRGREAIFKSHQFRSSFGGCDVAQRKALLCPSSLGEGWQGSWDLAVQSVQKTKNQNVNPLKNVNHYFFGKHFNDSKDCAKWVGVKPTWASNSKKRNPDIPGLKASNDCLEFYEIK